MDKSVGKTFTVVETDEDDKDRDVCLSNEDWYNSSCLILVNPITGSAKVPDADSYNDSLKELNLKVGDTVQVLSKTTIVRKGYTKALKGDAYAFGWENFWDDCMNKSFGRRATVTSISSNNSGIRLDFGIPALDAYYPPYVLKKIKNSESSKVITISTEKLRNHSDYLKKLDVKAGDKVRVLTKKEIIDKGLEKATNEDRSHFLGWQNAWVKEMNRSFGLIGTVEKFPGTHGVNLHFNNSGYDAGYPAYVLEKVIEVVAPSGKTVTVKYPSVEVIAKEYGIVKKSAIDIPNAKFKVGEIVKILDGSKTDWDWVPAMNQYIGKELPIKDISPAGLGGASSRPILYLLGAYWYAETSLAELSEVKENLLHEYGKCKPCSENIPKYKVGDRVKIKNSDTSYDSGTITNVDESGSYVSYKIDESWYHEKDLELISNISKFKVGDKVKILNGKGIDKGWVHCMNEFIGTIATIDEISECGKRYHCKGWWYAESILEPTSDRAEAISKSVFDSYSSFIEEANKEMYKSLMVPADKLGGGEKIKYEATTTVVLKKETIDNVEIDYKFIVCG